MGIQNEDDNNHLSPDDRLRHILDNDFQLPVANNDDDDLFNPASIFYQNFLQQVLNHLNSSSFGNENHTEQSSSAVLGENQNPVPLLNFNEQNLQGFNAVGNNNQQQNSTFYIDQLHVNNSNDNPSNLDSVDFHQRIQQHLIDHSSNASVSNSQGDVVDSGQNRNPVYLGSVNVQNLSHLIAVGNNNYQGFADAPDQNLNSIIQNDHQSGKNANIPWNVDIQTGGIFDNNGGLLELSPNTLAMFGSDEEE